MKNYLIYLFTTLCLFTACIPSLHPIYLENDTFMDDRIIGRWVSSDSGIETDKLDIRIETNDPDQIDSLNESNMDDLFGFEEEGEWLFDRAAIIVYAKGDGNSQTTVSMENQLSNHPDEKLIKKGFKVIEKKSLNHYILQYRDLSGDTNQVEKLIVNLTTIGDYTYMDFKALPDIREFTRFSMNIIPAHTFARFTIKNNSLVIQSFDAEYIEDLIKNKRVRLKHELVDDNIILTASTEDLRAFINKYADEEELFLDKEILTLR